MLVDRLLVFVLGLAWSPAGASAQCPLQWSGSAAAISDAAVLPDGDLVVVGGFTSIGGVAANRVARFDGTTWVPLGTGLDGPGSHVVTTSNGDVLVAGAFTTAGGVTSPGLARWDGTTWHAHPGAPLSSVQALAALPNGDVVVARNVLPSPMTGHVSISRWDGTAWQVIGTSSGSSGSTPNASVRDVEVLPDGTLVAVGTWLIMNPMGWPGPGGYRELVAWNGASWDYFYAAPEPEDLIVGRRGDVYLATGGVFSWIHHRSGGTWHIVGSQLFSEILTVAELPNGDLVAGGYQSPIGLQQMGFRRWNGTAWSDLGFWTTGVYGFIDLAVMHAPSGHLLVSGSFASAGGIPASNLAWLTTPCTPAAVSTATSCVGPAGPLVTSVPELPWTGAQLRTTTTGFGPASVAVVVLGAAAASLPLAGLLPTLSPGCDLLAAPDILLLEFPVGGVVDFAIDVPDVPALAGTVVYQQTAQLELAAGLIASVSVANGLALTLGTF